jgi:hypothetical protein
MCRRVTLLAVAVLIGIAAVAPMLATADEAPEFHRSPETGLPGSSISVSGKGCTLRGQPAQRAYVLASLLNAGHVYGFDRTFDVAVDGSWSGSLPVPADAEYGYYRLDAECQAEDMSWNGMASDFTVVDPAAPPTTTTTSTTNPATAPAITSTTAAAPTTTPSIASASTAVEDGESATTEPTPPTATDAEVIATDASVDLASPSAGSHGSRGKSWLVAVAALVIAATAIALATTRAWSRRASGAGGRRAQ